MDSRFLGLLADAAATLARLDARLSSAPACVTEGWLARALIGEAVASARLNGDIADAADLARLDADAIDRIPDPALGQAAVILAMLRQAASRSPRQLFTPRRLAAAVRLRHAGDRRVPVDLPWCFRTGCPRPAPPWPPSAARSTRLRSRHGQGCRRCWGLRRWSRTGRPAARRMASAPRRGVPWPPCGRHERGYPAACG